MEEKEKIITEFYATINKNNNYIEELYPFFLVINNGKFYVIVLHYINLYINVFRNIERKFCNLINKDSENIDHYKYYLVLLKNFYQYFLSNKESLINQDYFSFIFQIWNHKKNLFDYLDSHFKFFLDQYFQLVKNFNSYVDLTKTLTLDVIEFYSIKDLVEYHFNKLIYDIRTDAKDYHNYYFIENIKISFQLADNIIK